MDTKMSLNVKYSIFLNNMIANQCDVIGTHQTKETH